MVAVAQAVNKAKVVTSADKEVVEVDSVRDLVDLVSVLLGSRARSSVTSFWTYVKGS